jgi:hypothetical protein
MYNYRLIKIKKRPKIKRKKKHIQLVNKFVKLVNRVTRTSTSDM